MGVFDHALAEMTESGSQVFGPMAFSEYCHLAGIRNKEPASSISIDALSKVDRALRDADTMVLRLGRGTFGLVQHPPGIEGFFILDKDAFGDAAVGIYAPNVPVVDLLAFSLLTKPVEAGLVNLALASGLIADCLGLDKAAMPAPATGQSTFSFPVRPSSYLADVEWRHEAGQVEIDAMFVGLRDGEHCLFVIEAKSDRTESLAKHKLAYAVSAAVSGLPAGMKVIPVYLRCARASHGWHFSVAECAWSPGQAIDQLAPVACHRRLLVGVGGVFSSVGPG